MRILLAVAAVVIAGVLMRYRPRIDGHGEPVTMHGELAIEPADKGSRLTWIVHGDTGANPFDKLLMRWYRSQIAVALETGLDGLARRFSTSDGEAP